MKDNFKGIALILLLILLPLGIIGVGVYGYLNRNSNGGENRITPGSNIHDPNSSQKSAVFTQKSELLNVEALLGNDLISTEDGRSYLLVTLQTPKTKDKEKLLRNRKPLNLSIVIDRSGSMAGEKLEYVKEALYQLADDLTENDIVNIVIYDDIVEVVYESDEEGFNKTDFINKVKEVDSSGSTNLEGGVKKGIELVNKKLSSKYHNRVILLSDGLANIGVSDADQLSKIVETESKGQINVSTIGVGLDYDERIMTNIAKSGRGNYYFLNNPEEANDVFASEFRSMTQLLVDNIQIEFNAHEQFKVSKGIGYNLEEETGFKPYALASDETVSFLFEINAIEKQKLSTGDIKLVDLKVSYEPVKNEGESETITFHLPVQATVTDNHINMLADDNVYLAFVEGYKTEKLWAVYENLDQNKNEIANQELKDLIGFYKAANVRLDGKLDEDIEKLKEKQTVTEEYEKSGVNINSAPAGRYFQKDNQAESFDSSNK